MSSEIAIDIQNLSKCHFIYERPEDRLKKMVIPRLQKAVGLKPGNYGKEFWAVKNISFEVKKGEIIGIIGNNGSGKSTLLQLICGTLNPTNGSVATHGKVAALLELGSGFNPEFTGRENIYLNAAVFGLDESTINQKLEDIIAFADIGQFIDQPIKTFSTGMVVRLAFAVIAHVDADILVIDEALSVGDAFFVQKCMRFLRDFIEQGTLLFCSHDTAAVLSLCTKAILMKQGEIQLIGSPQDIVKEYLLDLSSLKNPAVQYRRNLSQNEQAIQDKAKISPKQEFFDQRDAIFNGSNLRNEIEVIQFEYGGDNFGTGDAKIIGVYLKDEKHSALSWAIGGQNLILEIHAKANKEIISPIMGFQIKDRLGQVLFCDNTYISYIGKVVNAPKGSLIKASFQFRLPYLRSGDYSVSPAIASGSQDNHIQHHWVHDALILKVQKTSVIDGLMGLGMQDIQLNIIAEN